MKRSRSDDIERQARKQAAHTRKIPLELSRLRQQMTEEQSRRVSAALAQLGDMVSDTRIVSSSAESEERGLSRWTVMEAANGDGVRANWVEVNDINVTVVAVAVAMNPQAAESAATGRPSVSAAAAATAAANHAASTGPHSEVASVNFMTDTFKRIYRVPCIVLDNAVLQLYFNCICICNCINPRLTGGGV